MHRLFVWLVVVSWLMLAAPPSHANGRPPAPVSISVSLDTNQMLVGTTFGAVLSKDGGGSWQWICEPALQMLSGIDPIFVWLPQGDLLATSYSALLRSSDGGCTWTAHPALPVVFPTDLQIWAGDANQLWLTSGQRDASTLFASHDAGTTFVPLLARDRVFFGSVRVAATDPQRLVVTGISASQPPQAILYQSLDGGTHWQEDNLQFVAIDAVGQLSCLGLAPSDDSVVFLAASRAVDGSTGLYRRTADGNLLHVLQASEPLRGMAFAANGQTVWVASSSSLQYSNDGGLSFAPLAKPHGSACVRLQGDTLLACGDYHYDDWSVARSLDQGSTWTKLFALPEVQGPLTCPAGSTTQASCPNLWGAMAAALGVPGAKGSPRATVPGTASLDPNCACNAAAHAFPLTVFAVSWRLVWRRLRWQCSTRQQANLLD